MTPLERIAWVRAVAADSDLCASAYRVAAFLADAFDSGRGVVAYGTATIARELGIARSTAQAGLYSLKRAGWIALVGEASRGRCSTSYRLTSTDRALGQSTDRDSSRLTDRAPGRNHPQPTDQPTDQPTGTVGHDQGDQGNQEESIDETAPDIPVAGYLKALSDMKYHLTFRGQDISDEWLDLGEQHGRRQVLAALRRLKPKPQDRFPSRVRRCLDGAVVELWTEEQAAAALADVTEGTHHV